ncbi:MAG: hypothetical protein JWL83_89 [Actinomycetia bacterium]|nr:hypothetical protein [Actinomycetes bacterium]
MFVSRLGARRDERGFALPMALAFLVISALMTTVILQYSGTAEVISGRFATQRNNLYAASGAIDAAIKYAQSDTTLTLGSGAPTDTTCPTTGAQFFKTTAPSGAAVTVQCSTNPISGGGGGVTTAPPFAILSLSPYHGPSPSSGCVNTNNELGIVQFQHSKLLQVNGDVYVNADVDADIWSGGCPQYHAALPMVVKGNVLQRESHNDFCAGPTAYDSQCTPYLPITSPFTYTAPISNAQLTPAETAALADPGLLANDPAGNWAPEISAPPAAGTIRDAANNVITTCPAIDPISGYRLVKFSAGTYNDATKLNAFMGGACPNAIFWFQPGTYSFAFTNAGGATAHEWVINDTTTRVVGGQPFAGPSIDPNTVFETWKPTAVGSTSLFTNPTRAFAIDSPLPNSTSDATIANGQTGSVQLRTFVNSAGTSIPADAQINSVRLRVSHGEDTPALVNNPAVTITPATGVACAPVTINKHIGVGEDVPSYDLTNCLNDVSKINSATSLVYSVQHCGGSANGCTSAASNAHLDGIWLDVTYTTGGRPAWNPSDPTTITPSSPMLPGSCLSDRDSGKGWSNGVQFVFSGDSRLNLKSGKVELCNKRAGNNKQEIVVYGTHGASASSSVTQPWNAQLAATSNPGFTNPNNAKVFNDGNSATVLLNSNGNRTLTLSQFSPTVWPIAAANQIPAGSTINSVTLSVRHNESSTTSGTVNAPTVTITPAGSAACAANTLGRRSSLGTDTINVTACLDTLGKINGGVGVVFSVGRAGSSSPTETLEGMQLQVTYTAPPTGGGYGTIPAETGCITQTPYYSPTDHSPAYNGACAVLRVSDDSNGGSFPRVLTLWGTVYTPSAALDVPVDIMTQPVFNRGVVARMLMLGYNVSNNAIVPITTTPNAGFVQDNRRMTLTTQIPGSSTSVVADVKLCDVIDADCPTAGPPGSPPVKILSWKVTR